MIDEIRRTWQEFGRQHVYAYRAIDPALYEMHMPDILRAIMSRSIVETIVAPDGQLRACLVIERPIGSEMVTVHWAWTHPRHRNLGLQKQLWAQAGLSQDSIVAISQLTVVAERMLAKYGWLFSPFSLYERHTQ